MDAEPLKDDGRSEPLTGPTDRPAGLAGLFEATDPEDAGRAETSAAYEGCRRRFVAAGGSDARFESLHLMAAARLKVRRVVDALGALRGEPRRDATESEIRTTLDGMAAEAIEAQGRGRFRAFRRNLWPFGSPLND
jgi:hypothetical protein